MQNSDADLDQNIDPTWIKIPTPTWMKNWIRFRSTFWPQFWSKAGSDLDQNSGPNFDQKQDPVWIKLTTPMLIGLFIGFRTHSDAKPSQLNWNPRCFNDLKNNAIQHRPELGPRHWSKTRSGSVQKSDPDVDQELGPILIKIPTPSLIKRWIQFGSKLRPQHCLASGGLCLTSGMLV